MLSLELTGNQHPGWSNYRVFKLAASTDNSDSGFLRNSFNLLVILQQEEEDPSFIFKSEPWLQLPDAPLALLEQYQNQLSYFLNSEDRHDSLLYV